jgi:hypothetical protein
MIPNIWAKELLFVPESLWRFTFHYCFSSAELKTVQRRLIFNLRLGNESSTWSLKECGNKRKTQGHDESRESVTQTLNESAGVWNCCSFWWFFSVHRRRRILRVDLDVVTRFLACNFLGWPFFSRWQERQWRLHSSPQRRHQRTQPRRKWFILSAMQRQLTISRNARLYKKQSQRENCASIDTKRRGKKCWNVHHCGMLLFLTKALWKPAGPRPTCLV